MVPRAGGTVDINPTGFYNCCGPLAAICLLFPSFKIRVTTAVILSLSYCFMLDMGVRDSNFSSRLRRRALKKPYPYLDFMQIMRCSVEPDAIIGRDSGDPGRGVVV